MLNIQPVIPGKLTENWNYIARIIQPIVYQPYPSQTTGGEFGFGDMNPTLFISPAKPGKVIWGAGPAFVIPTATNDILGQGKFSIGPSFVALTQPGHWTLGTLINNVWSVAGSGSRPDVNQMLLQYFVNYNLEKGYYISISPILTANWKAASGDVWTVPFGGGIGRIMKMGYQPVNLTAQFYANPIRHVLVGNATADCLPVSQADQAATDDDDGNEIETNAGRRTTPCARQEIATQRSKGKGEGLEFSRPSSSLNDNQHYWCAGSAFS